MRVGSDYIRGPLKCSFYSCEKDAEMIIKKLFVSSEPYSEQLKRLLVINTKDCLDNSNQKYNEIVKNTSIKELIEGKYITLVPRVKLKEHEEIKSYIILSFDNFTPTSNPEYEDCTISFDIFCHPDYWELGDYRIRPIKIAGIIKGLLDETKLSGIGTLQFTGMRQIIVGDELMGYSVNFQATHGNDDNLSGEE